MEGNDEEYDQLVRELAFDKRAKPKDRTKTEEELALEEKEALEMAESARIRRMMGDEDLSDEDHKSHKGRRRKWERDGDDLEDDFIDEDVSSGLGVGLGDQPIQELDTESEEDDSDERNVAKQSDSSDDEESDDDNDKARESVPDDISAMDSRELMDATPLISSKRRSKKAKQPAIDQELPFTFPCPESHDEFLSILEGIDDRYLGIVVQRIRSLHHPSLSKDNPLKLQVRL
jgi:nucleolar protein 14